MSAAKARSAGERPRDRGALKREQILDAAAKVLARRGYAATTLGEIAEEVGSAGAGSLYYHFDSRDELIEELLRRGVDVAFENSRRAIAGLPASASPLERLQAALRAHLLSVLVDSDFARASGRSAPQVPPEMWARINAQFRRYGKFYDQLFAAAIDSGELDPSVDRKALRMLVVGAMNWAPEWYRPSGGSTPEEIADLLVRMLVRGVGQSPRRK